MAELYLEWGIWMLEAEARKRVGDLSVYKCLFPFQDQYIDELRKIVELIPERSK